MVFVCGGTTSDRDPDNWTRRDTFFRIIDDSTSTHKTDAGLDRHNYKKAETIDGFLFREHYKDWLTLELDIARISDVTMLFCESPGSFAELGAFVIDQEIVQSLLVIIDQDKFERSSFIRHGIIAFLEKNYPKGSVFVLPVADMGITSSAMKGKDIDLAKFAAATGRALDMRLKEPTKHRTFNAKMPGHIIKLITGVVQDYGSLKVPEIALILEKSGVQIDEDAINRYIFCAETMEWLHRDRREFGEYITSTVDGSCVSFKMNRESDVLDRRRWRSDIQEYWKNNDPERFSSIAAHRSTR